MALAPGVWRRPHLGREDGGLRVAVNVSAAPSSATARRWASSRETSITRTRERKSCAATEMRLPIAVQNTTRRAMTAMGTTTGVSEVMTSMATMTTTTTADSQGR